MRAKLRERLTRKKMSAVISRVGTFECITMHILERLPRTNRETRYEQVYYVSQTLVMSFYRKKT